MSDKKLYHNYVKISLFNIILSIIILAQKLLKDIMPSCQQKVRFVLPFIVLVQREPRLIEPPECDANREVVFVELLPEQLKHRHRVKINSVHVSGHNI